VIDRAQLCMGLSVHTGWAACCVVGGDVHRPSIVARKRIEVLEDAERFVFHRDVMRDAAKACGLDARVLSPKDLDARAARVFATTPAEVASLLAAAGRGLGPPWGKDEKLAALAAWTMLAETRSA
jgi:hypothetical protein